MNPSGEKEKCLKEHSPERKHTESSEGATKTHRSAKVKKNPLIDMLNKTIAKDTHSLIARTGLKVSKITLGTMNFGEIDSKFGSRPGQLNEAEAHKILNRYVELGGNCIDTANFFPWFGSKAGESERIIGNWLKG